MSRDPISLETAERMLSFVRGVDDRNTWVKMAYVLKEEFGDVAFDGWNAWSMDSGSYNERDARDVWKSIKPSTGSNRATVGSLVALAKEGGWRPTEQDRRTVSPGEIAERAAERASRVEAERLATERERVECAARAAVMWAEASTEIDHPYVTKKQVTPDGVRVLGGDLLVPLRHGPGAIVGLQRIQFNGEKRLLKGTPSAGAYTVLGKPSKLGPIVICEGWATGCSIRMATGHCVVVAFNAGNLTSVARKIRAALPVVHIIIAADDDAWTEGNPGVTSATEAALATGALLAVPSWMGDRPEKHTDFNDLHLDEGLSAVADCVDNASEPVPPGGNRLAADQVQHAQPSSGVENSGSDGAGGQPTPAAVAGHQEPGPVILQASGSVVSNLPPLVDYHGWLPNVNDKGKPLSTIENVDEICRRLGVTVRYNVISKDEEILIPGAGFSLDNKANASLAWLISECAKFRMPVDRVPDFATYLADCNQYNPVAEWVLSKPWDGESRLQSLCETITAVGQAKDPRIEKMKNTFIRRWMISAIAGAFRPTGVSAHGVLVFQGDQYLGKTKWFKTLVPSHLGVLQDGMTLRPDDRDSVKQVVSHWLVELGELDATFRKSDIAALKAFITRDRDVFRRAFARKESEYARRTVFFASVNPREFLHDPTGNRRYWTIECATIDHSHNIDMQQCWAEVYALFAAGESWFLDADEAAILTSSNKNFEVIDPIEEMINGGMLWSSPVGTWRWRSATDVLRDLGKRDPTQSECTKASLIIRERNGKQSKRTGSTRQLLVPDLVKASQVSW